MKVFLWSLRILMLALLLVTSTASDPKQIALCGVSLVMLLAYEAINQRLEATIQTDTKTLIEKIETLEREFVETKNKISALSVSAGIKNVPTKSPFAR